MTLSDQQVASFPGPPPDEDMVWIPGGTFLMGSDRHYPEEAPVRPVTVGGFWIDAFQVTNRRFAEFVKATGHVTLAERVPDASDYPGAIEERLVAASCVFSQPAQRVDLRNHYNWWTWVPGADWRHPTGSDSSIDGFGDHPVVHVAWEDVEAFARWAGKGVPSESEWEYAARGGVEGAEYAWGSEFSPGGMYMANTWQGEFPIENLGLDGFERTSPVGSFPPNGYGLYDMIGNVWEWTADWYGSGHQVHSCCTPTDPGGPSAEGRYDPATPAIRIPRKVLKGGSHLCAPNYCRRYRPAARMAHAADTSTSHLGMRLIVRPPSP